MSGPGINLSPFKNLIGCGPPFGDTSHTWRNRDNLWGQFLEPKPPQLIRFVAAARIIIEEIRSDRFCFRPYPGQKEGRTIAPFDPKKAANCLWREQSAKG